jgi:hypothetical protein
MVLVSEQRRLMPENPTQVSPWDTRITSKVASVRLEALASRSTQIGLLSQSIGDIKKQIQEAGSEDGICVALVCWWLKGQKNDRPLLKQLLLPGGAVDEKLLAQLIADFQSIRTDGEKDYLIKELKQAGLVHRGSTSTYVTSEDATLGDWICEGKGSLSVIFIRGGTDHAMAIDLQKFAFFDPNVGEMQFGSESHLQAFLNKMLPKVDGDVPYWQYMRRDDMKFMEMERHSFR